MIHDKASRRRRRLTLLLSGVVGLAGLLVGVWFFQQSRASARTEALRVEGIAAQADGRYADALERLRPYLLDRPNDSEALLAAGLSATRLQRPEQRDLQDARNWLTQARQLDPQDPRANEALLALYNQFASPSEAVQFYDELLARQPDRADILRLKIGKLQELGQHRQAADAADAYLQQHPEDVRVRLMAMTSRQRVGVPVDQIAEQAQQLLEQHPDDAGFLAVRAYAHLLAQQSAEARTLLERAAQSPSDNAEFTLILVQLMDGAGMFGESLSYLESADRGLSSDAGREVIRRLFEAGQFERVRDRLNDLPGDATPELHAIRTMVLFELGERPEAEQSLKTLGDLPGTEGGAWASVLRSVYAPRRDSKQTIKAIEQAVRDGLSHVYLTVFLGEALQREGDHAAATQTLTQAVDVRQSWATPRLLRAHSALAQGQWADAERDAQSAIARRPDLLEARVVHALSLGNNPETLRGGRLDELLRYLDQLLSVDPAEHRIALLKVRLLADTGKADAAREAARAMLAQQPPPSAATLHQLAELSQRAGLGVQDDAFAIIESVHGGTPDLAYARAVERFEQGDFDAGYALLDGDDKQSVGWRIARARYLEHAGQADRARDAWTQIVESHGQDPQVLRFALRSQTARQNPALADQLITKLQESTGDSAEWRIERARSLLAGPDGAQRAADAERLLNEALAKDPLSAEAHALVGRARELQGRTALAINAYQAALRVQPNEPTIALELARLQQSVGDYAAARQSLQALADQTDAPGPFLLTAATMLATQADYGPAISLLETLEKRDALTPPARLFLAQLYLQSYQPRKAEWAVAPLLQSDPTPQAAAFAADLYARQGQPDRAQELLARLESLGISTPMALAIRAEYASRYGSPQDAATLYRQAADAEPANPEHWLRLVGYLLQSNQPDPAIAAARAAADALQRAGQPITPGLDAVLQHQQSVRDVTPDPVLRPLVLAMLNDPESREPAVASLNTLTQAQQQREAPADVAAKLRRLADEHAGFQALANITTHMYRRAGMLDAAAELARKTASSFPASAEPAALLAATLADQTQWRDAVLAARDWRARSADQPLEPDVLIARCQLALNQPSDAHDTLEPYLASLRDQPQGHELYFFTYAQSLLALRREAQARELLTPLLSQPGNWRVGWIELASNGVADPATREQWLKLAQQQLQSDSPTERFALAQAWWTLYLQTQRTPYRDLALEHLGSLIQREDATSPMWLLHAIIRENADDPAGAERGYRRALELDPSLHAAQNNLAMLLITYKPALADEALQRAQDAVAAQPGNPNYHDTLAHIQAALGRHNDALQSIETAIELDPANPLWKQRKTQIEQQLSSAANLSNATR